MAVLATEDWEKNTRKIINTFLSRSDVFISGSKKEERVRSRAFIHVIVNDFPHIK